MDAFEALAYERRSGVVSIRGRRFRVTEPRPRVASVLLTHLGKMLRPWVTKILAGQITRFVEPVCPSCGATKAEQVNGQRWLCQTPDADGKPCGALWPRETLRGEDGQPVRLTLSEAMSDPRWRALFALEVGRSIDEMDADQAHSLAMRFIVSGTEWDSTGMGGWVSVSDEKALDAALAQAKIGGMGIMRLAKAHMEIWALPSLVDDWTDTSPASPTMPTNGDLETREPAPQASAPVGREPPQTRKRRG